MRVDSSIKIQLSKNLSKTGEFGDHYWPESVGGYERGDSRSLQVPASTVDFEIDLTALISKGAMLALRADHDIGLKLNANTADQIPLEIVGTGKYAYFYVTGDVTKLYITTGSEMTGIMLAFVGDA
jgi:hypothetical protein